jgi:hypothetical protein
MSMDKWELADRVRHMTEDQLRSMAHVFVGYNPVVAEQAINHAVERHPSDSKERKGKKGEE